MAVPQNPSATSQELLQKISEGTLDPSTTTKSGGPGGPERKSDDTKSNWCGTFMLPRCSLLKILKTASPEDTTFLLDQRYFFAGQGMFTFRSSRSSKLWAEPGKILLVDEWNPHWFKGDISIFFTTAFTKPYSSWPSPNVIMIRLVKLTFFLWTFWWFIYFHPIPKLCRWNRIPASLSFWIAAGWRFSPTPATSRSFGYPHGILPHIFLSTPIPGSPYHCIYI